MNDAMVRAVTVALEVAKSGWTVAAIERCSAEVCPLAAGECPAAAAACAGAAAVWKGRELRPVAAVVPCFMVDMMAAEEGERPFGPCANCRGASEDGEETERPGRDRCSDDAPELWPEIAAEAAAAQEREPSAAAIATLDALGMLSRREAVAVIMAQLGMWWETRERSDAARSGRAAPA